MLYHFLASNCCYQLRREFQFLGLNQTNFYCIEKNKPRLVLNPLFRVQLAWNLIFKVYKSKFKVVAELPMSKGWQTWRRYQGSKCLKPVATLNPVFERYLLSYWNLWSMVIADGSYQLLPYILCTVLYIPDKNRLPDHLKDHDQICPQRKGGKVSHFLDHPLGPALRTLHSSLFSFLFSTKY